MAPVKLVLMVPKILKLQLFSLTLLTLFAFYSYYYFENLPDNVLMISSSDSNFSTLSYYFTSLTNIIGFYTGIWLFIPLFVFIIIYTLILSKRDNKTDVLILFFLIIFTGLLVFLFFSYLLGPGLRFILDSYLKSWMIASYMFVSFLLVFFTTFRGISLNKIIYSPLNLFLPKFNILKVRFLNLLSRYQNVFKRNLNEKEAEIADPQVPEDLKAELPVIIDQDQETLENSEPKVEIIDELKSNNKKSEIIKTNDQIANKTIKQSKSLEWDFSKYHDLLANSFSQSKMKKNSNFNISNDYFEKIVEQIEEKLKEFKIDGSIINVLKGPVVDTFELELGSGVKVSKVTSISEDLSLALYGAPIRIVYPMKGRTTVGIEVPRNPREIILLDEILTSKEFKSTKFKLPIAMGKDAFGEVFLVDLASMPHMLVAGATGAGKSVFINALLVSLLVKRSPHEMKLILIDPKQLELALYAKLPHLIVPVITDAKRASLSLMWAVAEMELRYSLLKEMGVRNIESYNTKVANLDNEKKQILDSIYPNGTPDSYELPFIVIIIDEFADLILTKAGKEIEHNVCRLAAKARAAGIHLIVATQRPSVDVITGLIKSNFPTRVSFRVTTSVDSRTILNAIGAEKLLGKGDMLYKYSVEMNRLHSAYVEEDEIEVLTERLCVFKHQYDEQAMGYLDDGPPSTDDPYQYGSHISPNIEAGYEGNGDDLYEKAVSVVMEHKSASASMLQRRLRVGYNRAANLIEEMEEKGIVGPAQGSRPRSVLSGKE